MTQIKPIFSHCQQSKPKMSNTNGHYWECDECREKLKNNCYLCGKYSERLTSHYCDECRSRKNVDAHFNNVIATVNFDL